MLAKVTLPPVLLFLVWPDERTGAAVVFSVPSVAKKNKAKDLVHKFLLPSLCRALFGFTAEFLFTSSSVRMLVGVVPVCGLRGIHCGFAVIWAVTYTGISFGKQSRSVVFTVWGCHVRRRGKEEENRREQEWRMTRQNSACVPFSSFLCSSPHPSLTLSTLFPSPPILSHFPLLTLPRGSSV